MKSVYFTILAALVMVFAASGAKAYDVNYSYVDPSADNYAFYPGGYCKMDGTDIGPATVVDKKIGTKTIGCLDSNNVCQCNNQADIYATKEYAWRYWNDFFTTNLCYRLSCYYQALSYADLNYVVQPLNKHASIVQSIISGYSTDGRLTQTIGVSGVASDRGLSHVSNTNNKFANRYPHPSYPSPTDPNYALNSYRHYQNGHYDTSNAKPDEIIQSPSTEIAKYEPGGGTSAFQGLLWSWRMLSSKWQGKWANQSFYEANGLFPDGQADRLANLPSTDLSKHIIIISDGLDNDGASNAGIKTNELAPKDDNWNQAAVRKDSSFGFEFNPANATSQPTGETCDAHGPEASITAADYTKICQAMNAEGITVYAIVFDGSVNEKLKDCVIATQRGLYIDNANICGSSISTPTNCQPNPTGLASASYLQDALTKVFAAIAAQSVRLVQ